MVEDKIILGIDPGTTIMGYGIIHIKNKKISLVTYGVIHLAKLATHPDKLKRIFERVDGLIKEFKPDEMAIEAPFIGKNVQSMLKLGRAQGVCIAASLNLSVPLEEYAPRRIIQAITGKGSASKEQVAKMLQSLLQLKELPKNLDSTDGLAAAVCHFYNSGKIEIGKNYTGWSAFVKQNEGRVKK